MEPNIEGCAQTKNTPLNTATLANKKPSYTLPILAYVLSCIIFGTSPAAIKTKLNYYTPSVMLFWYMCRAT